MPQVTECVPRINLRKKLKTDKTGYLFLIYRYNARTLVYAIGETVEIKYWNTKTSRTVFNKKYGQKYIDINQKLNELQSAAIEIYKTNNNISIEDFKLELDYINGKKKRPSDDDDKISLMDFIQNYIDERQNENNPQRGTWKKFITLQSHLSDFAKDKNELNWNDINWKFRSDFINWLYAPPRNHSQNTASKIIKNLKQVLNEATKRKINTNLTFKEAGFSIQTVKTKNKIRLTFNEINQLMQHNYKRMALERTRDLLVVGCFTGLRYSDWSKVNKSNVITDQGIELLEVMTEKTNTVVVIPFLPELKQILEKYDYKLPKLSLIKFNAQVKEVIKEAGIDNKFMRIYSKAGQIKTERIEKWQKASSHAARRSFATNFYDLGIPVILLMQITGHTTEKQFFEYIDVNQYEMAKKFAREVMLKRNSTM